MSVIKSDLGSSSTSVMADRKFNCICFECGHTFLLKEDEGAPRRCPKCKSPKIVDGRSSKEN